MAPAKKPDDRKKKNRAVRVEDPLWDAAMAKAEKRGESLSEEIRRFLERYVRRG